jgi:hypothetical protein
MPPLILTILLAFVAAIFVANVLASIRIVRDKLGTSTQKVAQFLLVWLLPIAGAIFVLMLTRTSLVPGSGRYDAKREEPDDDVAVAQIDYSSSD